jgi:NAD-dependent dihydropyrimidine dehydrogenase PreA subunit
MPVEKYEGIPREKIPWDPKIDYEKCITCGKCVDFCHMSTFKTEEKDGEKKTVVQPNLCVVLCRGCEDICLSSAISHPSEKKTKRIIEKLKKQIKEN